MLRVALAIVALLLLIPEAYATHDTSRSKGDGGRQQSPQDHNRHDRRPPPPQHKPPDRNRPPSVCCR